MGVSASPTEDNSQDAVTDKEKVHLEFLPSLIARYTNAMNCDRQDTTKGTPPAVPTPGQISLLRWEDLRWDLLYVLTTHREKRFRISLLLANYTAKWLLMSCAFWWTTWIFFDVRHDGNNSCLLVVRLDRDNSWSLRFWTKLTYPHFTTQENLWFLFQEVKKKKKKKTGDWCFCVRIITLSTAWWVTKGKLNFPLLKSLL